MKRLDGERYSGRASIGQDGGDAVVDHLAGLADVPARAGQATDYQHQALGGERGGFIDGAAIVVDRCLPPCRSIRREHAAAAEPGDPQIVGPDDAGGLV